MERVHLIEQGERLKIMMEGEMTLDIMSELKKMFDDLFCREWKFMSIDLSKVRFMDSSGIGFLTALNNRSMQMGRNFYLESPSDQVIKTLKLVNLFDYFKVVVDED